MDAGKGTHPDEVGGSKPESIHPVSAPSSESVLDPAADAVKIKTTPAQLVIILLGLVAFLYFARAVMLPVFLAFVATITLKPFVRWGCSCHIPPAISATLLLGLLAAAISIGSVQLVRPALEWMKEAPEHMAALRQRVQTMFPRLVRINEVAAAVTDLGATEVEKKEQQKKAPTVQIKDSRGTSSILNWTGSVLAGVIETLVLLFLLLASGDIFLHKLVHVMPTMSDKRRIVEISREIQQNISHYLFSVSLINLVLGVVVGSGFYFMGVPNAAMWGLLAAVLNFIPYFGPVLGVIVLAIVGLLTFDTLGRGILPPAWYLLVHLLEANLITPLVLGRRFALNPVVIFVSLLFWTWLWGVPGALLAVPILVSLKVLCDHVPSMAAVGELLSAETSKTVSHVFE
jgi:predicted PurR-regulated permease PerM